MPADSGSLSASALACLTHTHTVASFAVDMLARGASPYDVAKLLGDTVATVERHSEAHAESWRVAKVLRENPFGRGKRQDSAILKQIRADELVSRIL